MRRQPFKTLHDGFQIQHKLGLIQTTRLVFNTLFIGKHFNSEDELTFHSIDVKYTYLEKWFDDRVFDFDFPADRNIRKQTVVYTAPTNLFEVEVPSINATWAGYYLVNGDFQNQTLQHQNSIGIFPKTDEPYSYS